MPSQSRSDQSYVLSHSRKPAAKVKELLDRLGTLVLILAFAVTGMIAVYWLVETAASPNFFW